MNDKDSGKAKGGYARAATLTPEARKEIAKRAAATRWDIGDKENPIAINEGELPFGDITLDCYVLKDRRRLFHKKALAKGLGMKSEGGNVFLRTFNSKGLGSVIPQETRQKLDNPIVFKTLRGDLAHGYEALTLIEVCDAIFEAKKLGILKPNQYFLAMQAEIIIRSSAKIGIIALVDEATGYIKDKKKEEYRELFKEFIRQECREWEKEFPDQFFDVLYMLYNLRRLYKNKHPQFFSKFIRKYVYTPLANSNGAILEMLDEKNPVIYKSGGRKYKLFQFLTDQVGIPAFRAHLWQIIGIANATKTKKAFDKGFSQAFPQSGEQLPLFDLD
ncbi:MAG: hypothetical protein HZA77_01780 [Candidatus Schekmanbacteria bacterium]|nr:hypothetical protein [Candidatus Schekmanbacteria bacterium]